MLAQMGLKLEIFQKIYPLADSDTIKGMHFSTYKQNLCRANLLNTLFMNYGIMCVLLSLTNAENQIFVHLK